MSAKLSLYFSKKKNGKMCAKHIKIAADFMQLFKETKQTGTVK